MILVTNVTSGDNHHRDELLLAGGHASIDRRFCTSSEFGSDAWAQRGGCRR